MPKCSERIDYRVVCGVGFDFGDSHDGGAMTRQIDQSETIRFNGALGSFLLCRGTEYFVFAGGGGRLLD